MCVPMFVFGCVSGWSDWISTGLYLSPGMKTYVSFPPEIVNKGWKVRHLSFKASTSIMFSCISQFLQLQHNQQQCKISVNRPAASNRTHFLSCLGPDWVPHRLSQPRRAEESSVCVRAVPCQLRDDAGVAPVGRPRLPDSTS